MGADSAGVVAVAFSQIVAVSAGNIAFAANRHGFGDNLLFLQTCQQTVGGV